MKEDIEEKIKQMSKGRFGIHGGQYIPETHYVLGSVMGPHPFPTIVRDFQAVISKEILYLIFDYPHKHYTFKYFEV